MANWKTVINYLSDHSPQQQMQGVRNQVGQVATADLMVTGRANLNNICFLSATELWALHHSR